MSPRNRHRVDRRQRKRVKRRNNSQRCGRKLPWSRRHNRPRARICDRHALVFARQIGHILRSSTTYRGRPTAPPAVHVNPTTKRRVEILPYLTLDERVHSRKRAWHGTFSWSGSRAAGRGMKLRDECGVFGRGNSLLKHRQDLGNVASQAKRPGQAKGPERPRSRDGPLRFSGKRSNRPSRSANQSMAESQHAPHQVLANTIPLVRRSLSCRS